VIAITRSKCGIPISDIYFAQSVDAPTKPAPLCFFQQTSQRHPLFKAVQTSIVDLTKPIEEISAPLSKNTRYKIQRAEREGFTPRLTANPSVDEASLYAHFYDVFARHKGLPMCNRAKLKALCLSSALLLSSISSSEGDLLAAHAYVKDASLGRARLLYSASHFRAMSDSAERNKVGRANRLLHWFEILTLKNMGFSIYDLGGIPLDSTDAAKNSIAQFKLEFGGTPLVEYSGLVPTNLIGKVLMPLARRRV
jgi:lipid II:glycine glycyltransferase (peptidoglycan interpeptide bridge formation enzyme)